MESTDHRSPITDQRSRRLSPDEHRRAAMLAVEGIPELRRRFQVARVELDTDDAFDVDVADVHERQTIQVRHRAGVLYVRTNDGDDIQRLAGGDRRRVEKDPGFDPLALVE